MDEQKEANQPEQKTDSHANPPAPPPIDPPPNPPAPDPERTKESDKIKKSDRIMIAATIVIAFGTLVSAGAICFQWYEMHTGGSDTKSMATSAQQSATAAGNFATSAAEIDSEVGRAEAALETIAQNSAGSIKATQNAMRMEQRAWVAIGDISGIPEVGKQFIVRVTAVNSGRTFAKHFLMSTIVEVAPAGSKPNFQRKSGLAYGSISLLPPNGTYGAKNTLTGDGSNPSRPNPTQDYIDAVKSGALEITAYGRMDYIDIFNRPHWTVYCYRLQRDMVWTNCPEYNDADDTGAN